MSEQSLRGACLALLILFIATWSGLLLDWAGPGILGFAGFYPAFAVAVLFSGVGLALRHLLRGGEQDAARTKPATSSPTIGIYEVVNSVVTLAVPSPSRFRVSGPPLMLPTQLSTFIALVLHELAVDALATGSWSNARGEVWLGWTQSPGGALEILWQERQGPPMPPPVRMSFAGTLIERGLNGASIDCQRTEDGRLCIIRMQSAGK